MSRCIQGSSDKVDVSAGCVVLAERKDVSAATSHKLSDLDTVTPKQPVSAWKADTPWNEKATDRSGFPLPLTVEPG